MSESARAGRRRSPAMQRPPAMTDVGELAGVSHQMMLTQLATGNRMDSKLLVPAQIVVRQSTAPHS